MAPRLTVVLPAYREGGRVAAAVGGIRDAVEGEVGPVEIVVVDDGSLDDTAEQARGAGADRVLVLAPNRGKGAAVRAGVLAAGGATVAFTDPDLSYEPHHLLRVLEATEAGWDVVVGSRSHPASETLARPSPLRQLGSRLFNLPARVVLAGRFRDTQCGLKGFRADAARVLFSHARIDGFAFDVELLHLAERYGLSITEVPVALRSSPGSSVRFGPDALRMLRDLARIHRLGRRGAYDLTSDERAALARRPSHPAR